MSDTGCGHYDVAMDQTTHVPYKKHCPRHPGPSGFCNKHIQAGMSFPPRSIRAPQTPDESHAKRYEGGAL